MSASTRGRVDWSGVILFLVLTFAVTWGIWLGLRAVGVPFGIRTAIGMFGPALGALLVRLTRHEGFADAGLGLVGKGRKGAGWMYLAAYVTIPLLIAAAIGFALLTTYQHWNLAGYIHSSAGTISASLARSGKQVPRGFTTQELAIISLVANSALAFTLGIPFNMIFTFGEEFGWRGYLLPRLAPLGGIPAALITGVIWGLWHAPLILLDGYNYPGYPVLGIFMMIVFTTTLSVIFAWLRFRSGSVWPSTMAHAELNAQAGFGLVLLSKGNSLLRAPIGIIGLVPMIAFALWLALTGKLAPEGKRQGTNSPLAVSGEGRMQAAP